MTNTNKTEGKTSTESIGVTEMQIKEVLRNLRLRIEANEIDAIEENNRKFDGKNEFNRGWACAMATTATFIKAIEKEIEKSEVEA